MTTLVTDWGTTTVQPNGLVDPDDTRAVINQILHNHGIVQRTRRTLAEALGVSPSTLRRWSAVGAPIAAFIQMLNLLK
jgi:hypothetical protein